MKSLKSTNVSRRKWSIPWPFYDWRNVYAGSHRPLDSSGKCRIKFLFSYIYFCALFSGWCYCIPSCSRTRLHGVSVRWTGSISTPVSSLRPSWPSVREQSSWYSWSPYGSSPAGPWDSAKGKTQTGTYPINSIIFMGLFFFSTTSVASKGLTKDKRQYSMLVIHSVTNFSTNFR